MKKFRLILSFCISLFFGLNNVFASNESINESTRLPSTECSDLNLPFEYIPCMERKLKTSDESLNRNYKILMGKLNSKSKMTLRDSQRAWITFRDLNCRLLSQLEEVRKPQNGMQVNQSTVANINCLVDFTEKRTKEFSELIETY